MSSPKQPQGVVGVFISPQGDVTASISVFERPPGGFSLLESQKTLAERRLSHEVAKEYCAPDFANALTEFDLERIMENMGKDGFKVVLIPVGYEE